MVAASGGKGSGGYSESVAPNLVAASVADAWQVEDRVSSVDGLQELSLGLHRHAAHGTTAVLAHVGGPLCSASMFFATEASDNKGLVHCLEHLCFMGSKSYKKGFLDFLAMRCGCEGANAYTDADRTCFEFTAAGEVGLLAVLPVFVNHVLCPALSDDAFVTEICHVNGKGERQGVVFSEMLGRVNDEGDMLDLERRRATFGDESPYSYEHGGLPDHIMKLTRGEIADYHRQVYTTDNLHIILSGTFDEAKVLAALGKALDDSVLQGAQQSCMKRPYCCPLPSLPSLCPRRRSVKFPSDDVSVGTVAYSHKLKDVAFNDVLTTTALDVLGRYLTGLASSPLEQAFVQCDPPVAIGVTFDVNLTAEPHLIIELSGVPFQAPPAERAAAKKLGGGKGEDDEGESKDDADGDEDEEIEDDEDEEGEEEGTDEDDDDEASGQDWFQGDILLQRLVDQLRKVCDDLRNGEEKAMSELLRTIKKEKLTRRVDFEDSASEFVCDSILPHLLFKQYPTVQPNGTDVNTEKDVALGALRCLQAHAEALELLSDKTGSWWADLLDKQALQALSATCLGQSDGTAEVRSCPSAVLCLQQERREEKQAKKNAKSLGKKKLKALQERVDAAEEANGVGLDEEQEALFPPPVTPECVPDYPWAMELMDAPEGGIETLDVEISSGFSELHVSWLFDSDALPGRDGVELQMYLNLFASLLCETDVAGQDYRLVVARLDDELVSHSAGIGLGSEVLQIGSHRCQVTLKLSAEPERAADLVGWADRLAHECDFPEEKVLSTCRRIITGLKASMRESDAVLSQVMTIAMHSPLSPQVLSGTWCQKPFLERCCDDIPGTCVALRKMRDLITAPSTAATAVISGNTSEERSAIRGMLETAWRSRHGTARPSLLQEVKWTAAVKKSLPPLLPVRHFVVGCAGTDTANVHLYSKLALPPLALDAKKLGAMRLLCEALSMMEGPLTNAVRGKGLAYGASIDFVATDNAVTLDLWECTNVGKALQAALDVVREAVEEDLLNDFQLDNARGSIVFQQKSKRATPTRVVGAAAAAADRGWRTAAEVLDWETSLASVTRDDVLLVLEECVMQLCDASKVVACVVCDPSDCKKAAKGLAAGLGIDGGAAKVFVKESIADCYSIVDGRIRAALAEMSASDPAVSS